MAMTFIVVGVLLAAIGTLAHWYYLD